MRSIAMDAPDNISRQDRELVDALRSGSQEGFERLVQIMHTSVRAYLTSFIGDVAVADDLAQDTFLAAYRDRASFAGRSTVSTWLLGIARNRALGYLRNKLRQEARGAAAWDLAQTEKMVNALTDDVSVGVNHERGLSALHNCIDKLAPHSGRLVAEHYFRHRPLVDLAREDGRKESTVRVELLRVRAWLRRCVETALSGSVAT
jgi:RNA polymerase sigma-70 factor, ECF subfamily